MILYVETLKVLLELITLQESIPHSHFVEEQSHLLFMKLLDKR